MIRNIGKIPVYVSNTHSNPEPLE